MAVALGEAPVVAGLDVGEPVAGRPGAEVVALIHADEQVARAGLIGEAEGGSDALRVTRTSRPSGRKETIVADHGEVDVQ